MASAVKGFVAGRHGLHRGFAQCPVAPRRAQLPGTRRIAQQAEQAGCLIWPPRDEPYPVGYYCGLRDPAGNYVEFSYGQPLGPGSEAMPIP